MKARILSWMTAVILITILSSTSLSGADPQPADSVVILDKMVVIGTKGDMLNKVSQEQSSLFNPAQLSAYKSISLLPSVNHQSVDPYSLADIVQYRESFRFRGVEPTASGVAASPVLVENLPLTGRPGGGINIYDMENFRDIAVYTGGTTADRVSGFAESGGKVNLNVIRPGQKPSLFLKQSGAHRRGFPAPLPGEKPEMPFPVMFVHSVPDPIRPTASGRDRAEPCVATPWLGFPAPRRVHR